VQLLRKHLLDIDREKFYETRLGFSWKLFPEIIKEDEAGE